MQPIIGCLRLVGLMFYIIIVFCAVLFLFPFMGAKKRNHWIRRLAAGLPFVLGVKVTVQGQVPNELLRFDGVNPQGPGYLVVANHISFVDVFALDIALPCKFVAKSEIASWPIFGTICKGIGTLFIERERRRSVLAMNKLMGDALEKGNNVLFFPEGTTAGGDALLPFHANLFSCAIDSKAQVLPISIRYLKDGQLTTLTSYAGRTSMGTVLKRIVFNSGLSCELFVGQPIEVKEDTTRFDLCNQASAQIAQCLGMQDQTAIKNAERMARLEQVEHEAAKATVQTAEQAAEKLAAKQD